MTKKRGEKKIYISNKSLKSDISLMPNSFFFNYSPNKDTFFKHKVLQKLKIKKKHNYKTGTREMGLLLSIEAFTIKCYFRFLKLI